MNIETTDNQEVSPENLPNNDINHFEKINEKFKNVFTHQYVAIIVFTFLLGYFSNGLFSSWKLNSTQNTHEIKLVFTQQKGFNLVKVDSLAILKLQNSIDLIETKNNGRFEVLTWAAYLVIILFVSFMTFNVVISTGKVKEVVDNEIEKKSKKLEKLLSSKLVEFNDLAVKAEKEITKLSTVGNFYTPDKK